MKTVSRALPSFWETYDALPREIQLRAQKQYRLFVENPRHPSLQLKPVGGVWSARVSDQYRALAILEESIFTWFWIGTHDQYDRLLNS